MAMDMFASVIGVFEYKGTREDAMNFVLDALSGDNVARDFTMLEIEITQWTDPVANEPIVVTRAAGDFHKFNFSAAFRFTVDGNYVDAHRWVTGRLYQQEEVTHMNLQTLRLSGAQTAGRA